MRLRTPGRGRGGGASRTLAALAGVSVEGFEGRDPRGPDRPDGLSQRGTANLDAYARHDPTFDADRFHAEPFSALRTPEYRYVESRSGAAALHDLPDETTDVRTARPGVAERLATALERRGVEWRDDSAGRVEFDEATRARLRDMGYLGE